MKTNKCPYCGAHNRLVSKKCFNCGANITAWGILKPFIIGLILLFAFVMCQDEKKSDNMTTAKANISSSLNDTSHHQNRNGM